MEKWITIAAVTVATTVAACTASQQSVKLRPALSFDGQAITNNGVSEYERGKQLLRQGRFAVAAQALQAALFADGTSIKTLNALAVSYDELGRYDLSARYYQRALMLDPANAQTLNNLAVSLARRGSPGLAVKVLADARPQLTNDKIIAANLNLAQAATRMGRVAIASAPLPLPVPSAPQVPRIEPTSPSTQQLITSPSTDARPKLTQTSTAAPSNGHKVAATMAVEGRTTEVHATDGTTKPPAIASELLQAPTIASHISEESAVPGAVETKPAKVKIVAQQAKPEASAVGGETLAPPPAAVASTVGQSSNANILAHAGYAPHRADHEAVTSTPNIAVIRTSRHETAPAMSESAKVALARTRLGSRIAESENMQPVELAVETPGTRELAMGRLGMRLEVANGAGRRYMAARMRSFLDTQGFDVAHVTNAHSFDHMQTVIAYREGFQPQATALAKMLAAKVELRRVAELPVDVRLILGHDLLPFDRTLEIGG